MLLFLSLGVAMIFAGRLLVKLKNYSFVRSTGFLECAFFPFGTILGIFTIVVLSRESVRKLFNSKASNPPPLPGKDKEVWDY